MRFLRKNSKKGFTIVELMVVVALIAILATLSFVGIEKYRIQARDRVRVADINKIRLALEQYKLACGEYPERLEPRVNNGCPYGQKLSDFLPHVPVNQSYSKFSELLDMYGESQIIHEKNTYFYSALSNRRGGKCYDYHIGVALERGGESPFLQEDHDVGAGEGKYKYECRDSRPDFSKDPRVEDEKLGLYDFRSKHWLPPKGGIGGGKFGGKKK